ncbi:hypothetical protein [Fibrobacter sp. UWEL]|uniref:hypothetical protein n=1 Tax=Fibrobacter sp. UWEL TaxID=1896209 RepID=UPI0009207AF3|nr:hypothetical protein [Fibrobacter sp. UWEL]SHK79600.1 hypothetical protein SAMN05720468_10716 [Fibrobacter sp. UWEL]
MPIYTYDPQFKKRPFYTKHPYMQPFVGENYDSPNHKKLLLVGESHYMPEHSTVHHHVNEWYHGAPVLSIEEQRYCDTAGTRAYKSGRFGEVVEKHLQSVLPVDGNAWEETASINYYMRPADYLENIQKLWKKSSEGDKQTDKEFAIENLLFVMDVLKPDLMIFLSKQSCVDAETTYKKLFGTELWDWTSSRGIEYIYTYHPSCPCWHSKMKYWKAKDANENSLVAKDFFDSWLRDNWI